MVKATLYISILLFVLREADGQSTTEPNSRCTYTFSVPGSDCGQRDNDDQLLKSSVVTLQAQVRQLIGMLNDVSDNYAKLQQEIGSIKEGEEEGT